MTRMTLCTNNAGGNVVSLSNYQANIQFPVVREVEAYWEGLRHGRQVPLRSEVDPRGIENALEYAFILERIAPGIARFRLAGMHLNDLMGMEVRGMPITAFFRPEGRKSISLALENLFEKPEKIELDLTAERGIGKPPLDARLLMLPLKSDLGDVSRALGCLVSVGQIGRTPRRFEMRDEAQIAQLAHDNPSYVPPPAPSEAPVAGMAEEAAPFTPKRPNLRVVKSDE